ncbi:TetR/AcrR family transcriptional regulator [Plantactinospora siamensis]|uniref:TetR/AcrR family transcriptional regulator n=1 Tax=Plantactinospora siamensis TaxID=555372 RepID=A0ABV6P8J0_9ACTN
MGHREDLLAGAVTCLRAKGYARTTARDVVAVSGTNLGSIGYHYGSLEALMNAAVERAMEEFADELAEVMATGLDPGATVLERFEAFWTRVLDSFEANRQLWLSTFDLFGLLDRVPQVRTLLQEGMRDGRLAWAQLIHGADPATRAAFTVGAIHQALLSGVLVQWLIDPEHAPTAQDLSDGLRRLAADVGAGREPGR